MKVLVTGGAGYVGSTLVPLLLQHGHSVRVLDSLVHGGQSLLGVWSHPAFELVRGDIRDPAVVHSAVQSVESVVHLAAIVGDPACMRQPDLARAVNLEASQILIEECRKAGVSRFVFASTCSNYGRMSERNGYVDETSELKPVSLYAETKVAVEGALLTPGGNNGFCPTVLRFATVFGVSPRMRFDLTVNEFTAEMLLRKKLVVFGEQFWRPYIHVRDAARAIQCILDSPPDNVRAEVFNAGSTDQNYQKQQLVELIRPFAPDAMVEYIHKDEDPRDYRVSFEKIRTALNFTVSKSVVDGVSEIVRLMGDGIVADFTDKQYRN